MREEFAVAIMSHGQALRDYLDHVEFKKKFSS